MPIFPKLECPFNKTGKNEVAQKEQKQRTLDDEFKDFKHLVDPGYKQYEQFFDSGRKFSSGATNNNNNYNDVYNVSNDNSSDQVSPKTQNVQNEEKFVEKSAEEREDEAIDGVISQLARIVGELEFQMGLDSILAGRYDEAVQHFTLSTRHNHPGGVFNLALCYEQGMGVKRNMKTARKLYGAASELGSAKAFYNLGVFYAQGLGGAKDVNLAKKYFEQAAFLGNSDALDALRLLLPPPPKKLPIIEEHPDDELFYNDKMKSSAVSAIANQTIMRRIVIN